jgi:hypothetical protein
MANSDLLAKSKGSDLDKAILLEQFKMKQNTEQPSYGDQLLRQLGLTARVAGPTLAGATAGAAIGAPFAGVGAIPGAIAGAAAANLAQPVADILTAGYNYATGRQAALPSQGIQNVMTAAGLPVPATPTERVMQSASGALIDAATGAGAAKQAVKTLAPLGPQTTTQRVLGTLAEQPGTQMAASATSGGVSQTAREMGAPEAVSLPLGLIGGVPFAVSGRNLIPKIASAERDTHLKAMQDIGVPTTPAQETGNPFAQVMESVFKYLPTSAPKVASIEDAQQRMFTRALMKEAGVESDIATPEVLRNARKAIGKEYDALESQTQIKSDGQLFSDINAIDQNYASGFTSQMKAPYKAFRDEILDFVQGKQVGPQKQKTKGGKSYKDMQSSLAEEIAKANRSDAPGSNRYAEAIQGLSDSLASAMERSTTNPELRAVWQDTNRRYANLMRVEDAMSMAGQEKLNTGFIPPQQIATVVRTRNPREWVEGGNKFTELVRSGAATLPNPTPRSGSPERNFMQDLVTGGLLKSPLFLGGTAAQGIGTAVLGPAAALGGPYAASRLYYKPRVETPMQGLLAGEALRAATEERR